MSNNIDDPDEKDSLIRASSTIDEGKNIVLMKKGDYSVHILVEEVKSLIQISENHNPYPIVKLTVFNKSKRTEKTKIDCTNYVYDEHFYFDKTNLTVEQLDSSKIIIEVFDSANSRKRKDYFGICEFDLQYIYSMKNHSLNNHWLALSNPESKDMTQIRGYLKLSISVLHDNDPRVELKSNPDSINCFIPSQIKVEYRQLSIYLMRVEEVPDMDSNFTLKKVNRPADPFVEFQYFGLKIKSKYVKNVNDVAVWNQIINIPVQYPYVSQKIVMLVKDYDQTINDDDIGSYEININDITGEVNKYKDFRYIDIYGASRNKKTKINNLMNTNAEIGSAWNGRILLKIDYKETDTPITSVVDIKEKDNKELLDQVNKLQRNVNWMINVKLYCAYYLPKEYKKYKIRICMQDSFIEFEEKEALNEYIEWNKVSAFEFSSLNEDMEQLPDMFFYLLNKDDVPVCFQRIKSTSFHLNDQIMIIKLFPEPCYDKVKSTINSGLLKVKIALFNKITEIKKIDFSKFVEGETDEEKDDDKKDDIIANASFGGIGGKLKDLYTVVCVVYMCRYLVSQDSSGNNDPYVRITCVNEKRTTSTKHETINGIWNETLIFDGVQLDLKKKSTWPILLAEVLDYDSGKDDLLGSSYIWLSDSPYRINDTTLIKPKWHQLYLPKSNSPQGELLLSFYIFDQKPEHKLMFRNINPIPETKPYTFEINILGLRDIKPLAMLPIKKAYIKFDMNSLNVSGEKENNLPSKTTQPKDKGSNPTINTSFKFDINLPKNEIFMPQLQCQVFDYIFSGMFNPSLGLFLLDLKKLIAETKKQIEEDTKSSKDKLAFYLSAGIVKNTLGHLGNIDKLFDKEKNNNIEDSNENIISTSTSKDIDIINKAFDKNKNNEIKNDKDDNEKTGEELEKLKNQKEITVYTKNYDAQFIEKNKDIPEYFVVLPQYKTFFIPGSEEHRGNKKGYQIEDLSLSPSKDDYLPIGYIPKYNHDKDTNYQEKMTEEEKGKIYNIKKHYRRFYRTELEKVHKLNIKSPFYTSYIRRGKDKDLKDETAIFTALANEKNKIIKSYDPKDDNKTWEEKEKIKKEKRLNNRIFGGLLANQLNGENVLPRNLRDRGFGKFKAVIRVCDKETLNKFQKEIDNFKSRDERVIKELKNIEKYEKLTKSILVKHEVIIRVYILELHDLPAKDLLSDSDPYIKIYFGGEKKYDEQSLHHNDKKNVKWYKYYDILSIFPGESTLKIEVWDYNPIFKDTLIGTTSLDLEDRYFNSDWQNLKFKPIETRQLIHPDISSQQGNISLWVEIFEKSDSLNMTPWQICPEPITKVQLRLVIWETEDMRMMDVEDTSDIYVTAFIDPKDKQSTDTHYRCQTGIASFNWRIVLDVDVPRENNILTIHAYDKDIFSRDDFISGANIDIKKLLDIPKDLDAPITFSKKYYDSIPQEEKTKFEEIEFLTGGDDEEKNKFWIQCYQNNIKSGRILCSMEILPMWKAEANPVGLGRKEPNHSPYLPPPVGRFQWSWNPFKIFNQCIGPRFRKKIYKGLAICCCVVYLIFLIPYIIYHLSGQIVNPFNYVK